MSNIFTKFKNFFSRDKPKRNELRSIIRTYYGNDVGLFAVNYANSIDQIPEVRTVIETFAQIFATIPKYFERVDKEGHIQYFENAASRVINVQANPLENATQFWVDAITQLMLNSNCFIEPIFNSITGELEQLYVLPKDEFEFKLYDKRATVRFLRIAKTYDLDSLIYLNRFSQLAGGRRNQLGLYETVIQALAAQAINVANPKKPRALLQGAGSGGAQNLKAKDKKGTMTDLKGNFDEAVEGVAYIDSQWKITPINWQENDVNRELMQFVINIVYNYFGITESIINNKCSEIEFELFVKNKIEPLARQVEQEFTSKLFTKREREFGNRLELDTFRLSVSTLAAKTAFFNVAGRGGFINIDEGREMIGLPPLPNGLGRMYRVTADTVNIEKFDEYQLAKNGNPATAVQEESAPDAEGEVNDELLDDISEVTKQPLLVGQLESLANIIAGYQAGTYTYNQSISMLKIGVGLTQSEAEELLDKQNS